MAEAAGFCGRQGVRIVFRRGDGCARSVSRGGGLSLVTRGVAREGTTGVGCSVMAARFGAAAQIGCAARWVWHVPALLVMRCRTRTGGALVDGVALARVPA